MSLAKSAEALQTLIRSLHPIIAIETVEEERVQSLLKTVSSDLQLPLFNWSVTQGLARYTHSHGAYATNDPVQLLKHLETLPADGIYWLKDFSQYLQDPVITRLMREVAHKFTHTQSTIVLTGNALTLPADIETDTARYTLSLPDYHELRGLLRSTVSTLKSSHNIKVEVTPNDVDALLDALNGMTLNQARQALTHAAIADGKIGPNDIQLIQERKVETIREGGLLEYIPAAHNQSELGGFPKLKTWLKRARIGFTPAARELNLTPPRGICLVGIQGCGKSLSVKVIARQWSMPLLKLDAGQLYDKYVGETEKNLRKAIAMAEAMAPIVLWIDEIEKALASGNGGGEESSLNRRILGYFLTWLQEKEAGVFVVATANDLSVLPPELLRKGRFDEIFFVDLPSAAERKEIFHIHLLQRKQDPTRFDLSRLTDASEGFSGAEIEQAIVSTLYQALYENQPLHTDLLVTEIEQTVPLSVSRREDVEYLQEMAKHRFVSVR